MLEDVVRFVDQSYDDSLCATTDFANKAAAVEGLRNSVGVVTNKYLGQFLQQSLKPAYSSAEAEIIEFVNTHSVWTDATNIVASVKAEFLYRVEGRIPPPATRMKPKKRTRLVTSFSGVKSLHMRTQILFLF